MAGRSEKTVGGIEQRTLQGGGIVYRAKAKVNGQRVRGDWRPTRDLALKDKASMTARRRTAKRSQGLLTIAEAMDLSMLRLEKKGRAQTTRDDRESRFRMLKTFFDDSALLAQIEPGDVELYYAHRRKTVGNTTIHSDLRALNSCFSLPEASGLPNPIKFAEIPDPPKPQDDEVDWFRPEELGEILNRIRTWPKTNGRMNPPRDADICEFLALTGCRLSEATELTAADVNLKRGTVTVSFEAAKTNSRVLQMSPDAKDVAGRLIEQAEGSRLFPVNSAGLEGVMRRWKKRLQDPRWHAHALRHTFGTTLALNGASAHEIKAAMGHSTLHMALRYIHVSGSDVHYVKHLSYRHS